MPNGTMQVYAALAENAAPLPNVTITITSETGAAVARLTTDASGAAPEFALDAPDVSYSLDETNTAVRPYAVYGLRGECAGYQTVTLLDVQIFAGQQTVARLQFLPAARTLPDETAPETIPTHPLFTGTAGSGPAPAADCAAARVLNRVVIPKKITVHLGRPAANAANETVSFQTYIANVASSEVYPTWVEHPLPRIFICGGSPSPPPQNVCGGLFMHVLCHNAVFAPPPRETRRSFPNAGDQKFHAISISRLPSALLGPTVT